MPEGDPALAAATAKMRAAGVAETGIRSFERMFGLLRRGDTGRLPDAELQPLGDDDVPALAELPETAVARELLDATVVIKLNGGLGTSMGLSAPKSLIEVKPGTTFLDVIVRGVLALRERHGVRLPLLLLDSFSTREATLRALQAYPELGADVPLALEQHREPRLRAGDLHPVAWPADPRLEWTPPGHGDLYAALYSSGALRALLDHGYRYAFTSNADNLGAILEPRVLAWLAAEDVPFAMEVVRGTPADRKGGHLARRDGRLVLRETAQAGEGDSFADVDRWRFYNTNNLWLDLERLAALLDQHDGVLPLPLIVNDKRVDPADASSPEVVQLETAMGAAVGVVDGARAVLVPRSRFAPVKTTDDLLVVRSDAYELTGDGRVVPAAGREEPPYVALDPEYFAHLLAFEARFSHGPPSLRRADRLVVRGDVRFGRGVAVVGDVEVDGPATIPDGAVLEGPRAA